MQPEQLMREAIEVARRGLPPGKVPLAVRLPGKVNC